MPRFKPKKPATSTAPLRLYEEILNIDPGFAAACINLGTVFFHLRQFGRAEELYRRATIADPGYVLAYFDLGNVLDELERLDESIAAYRKAVSLSPRYADAHYNLALAYERLNQSRNALRHWQAYVKLDNRGPWADHARSQIRKLLSRENLPSPRAPSSFPAAKARLSCRWSSFQFSPDLRTASATARICAGRVRQHPPTICAPALNHSAAWRQIPRGSLTPVQQRWSRPNPRRSSDRPSLACLNRRAARQSATESISAERS